MSRGVQSANAAGVRLERRGAVALWTIDRTARMNALSRATVQELGRLAHVAQADSAVRAVVITGAGARAFSAGADLKERQSMSEQDVLDFLALYRTCFDAIDNLTKPVVAAINGVAFGGGLELALACDLRVAAATAVVGLTETSLGIIPGAGGTQRMTRLLGEARAKELILFAKRLSAQEAASLGLIHRVTGEGRAVLDDALEWIGPLVDGAPIALASALSAIDAVASLTMEQGLNHEQDCYERTLRSSDRLEALDAFREKRKPVFKGE